MYRGNGGGRKMAWLSALAGVLYLSGDCAAATAHGTLPISVQSQQPAHNYAPLTFRDEQWYGSAFWTGPDWTRVGKDWQHCGESTSSVRCFVSPRTGRATVSGQVFKADTNGGDGVRVCIRAGDASVWQAEIEGNDSAGVTHSVVLDLRQGDTVRFVVHRRGTIVCDTTHWDPEVAFEDGARFRASEGFASAPDDSTPWRYEMETTSEREAETANCQLRAFTANMLPQTWDLDAEAAPVRLTSGSHVPLAIVTRRGERAGTLILADNMSGDWALEIPRPDTSGQVTVHWESQGAAPRVTDYTGDWTQALAAPEFDAVFRNQLELQQQAFGLDLPTLPPMLWALVTDAWLREDGNPTTADAFAAAARTHLERCLSLTAGLEGGPDAGFAAQAQAAVTHLMESGGTANLYVAARRLKRELLLHRPEFAFSRLFFCKRVPTSYSHLVMQYFGWRARPGGGLFILERPGYSMEARDILGGQLAEGSVLQPCLDWNGDRIVFSYVAQAGRALKPEEVDNERDDGFFHLWSMNIDGSDLRQLTAGAFDDLMPTWLPDGDIVFSSTRRRGYSRCFGPAFSERWHCYTLHRYAALDGAIERLSSNDVSEWFPVVAHDGMVYYSRWDYIDRDAVTHQSLWNSRPDGTNPAAVWGNGLPSPHCTFQIQPIPDSNKFVFVASAHHSMTGGSLVVLDPARGENAAAAVQRITPEVPFPEAETRDIPEWYAAPWPLAEDLFLTAYSPYPLVWEPGANRRDALGIYLLDTAGNRELIYRDPEISATNPIPLRARPRPPVLVSTRDRGLGDLGEFLVTNVYDGLKGAVERGTVKELRVIQIFPKATPLANTPPVGLAGEENARAVLGVVPVAEDGSARFLAPANKPLLFQLLDADGRAVQIMRSLTYLQPGERISCAGCHEGRGKAARNGGVEAARHEPAKIAPGPYDGRPFSYMRVVQPVLDDRCVRCHSGEKPPRGIDLTGTPDRGFSRSYLALLQDVDARRQAEAAAGSTVEPLVPRYPARNQVQITPPGGQSGSRGALLLRMLDAGHNDVRLSPDEKRRLALWIDCNAIFYSGYTPEQQQLQLAREDLPMPELE